MSSLCNPTVYTVGGDMIPFSWACLSVWHTCCFYLVLLLVFESKPAALSSINMLCTAINHAKKSLSSLTCLELNNNFSPLMKGGFSLELLHLSVKILLYQTLIRKGELALSVPLVVAYLVRETENFHINLTTRVCKEFDCEYIF